MLKYGIRAPFFNIEPRWAKQVEIEAKFHRDLKLQGAKRAPREHFDDVERSRGVVGRETTTTMDLGRNI
jgi:hypothetical protein